MEFPFEKIGRAEWRAQVDKELKGKPYEDFLVWKSLEGFNIESWQDQLPDIVPILIQNQEPWKAIEFINEPSATEANTKALASLMAGAEGIWFEKSFRGAAAEVAIRNIDQDFAPVFIKHETLLDYFGPTLKHGTDANSSEGDTLLIRGERLRERGATVIQEVALMLAQGIEALAKSETQPTILFSTGLGYSYLTELSKIRAFRWLWSSVLTKEGYDAANPQLLATNLTNEYSKTDEYTNVLRATSSGLAGAIGGATYVMIKPWDHHFSEASDFSSRITRNIQTLMKDEARIDKNLNPSDGSFFIENLTSKIAELAWAEVQRIEEFGGFSTYTLSKQLLSDLNESRNEKLEAYMKDESILLGSNKYPPISPDSEPIISGSEYSYLPDVISLSHSLSKEEA
jgi:methylmalonyl-CoA mutase